MSTLTEGKHNGEFIVSESNGSESRDTITVAAGNKCTAAQVMGTLAASGKVVPLAPAANDGSQTASCVLIRNTDATLGDKKAAVIIRHAEVRTSDLNFGTATAPQIAAARLQLAALGVICRDAI